MKITAKQLRQLIEHTVSEDQKPKTWHRPPSNPAGKGARESDPRATMPQQAVHRLRAAIAQQDRSMLPVLQGLLRGLIELTNATGDQQYIEWAKQLAKAYRSNKPVFQTAG